MRFIVQVAQTRNYEIEVDAADETAAKASAMEAWLKAPDVGFWEIADTETEIVAVTANPDL